MEYWHTGAPTEEAQYLIIAKAKFTSFDNSIKEGQLIIFAADWNVEDSEWCGFNESKYDIIWWRKLSTVALCLPKSIEGEEIHYW